jgi:hypothetical protein
MEDDIEFVVDTTNDGDVVFDADSKSVVDEVCVIEKVTCNVLLTDEVTD